MAVKLVFNFPSGWRMDMEPASSIEPSWYKAELRGAIYERMNEWMDMESSIWSFCNFQSITLKKTWKLLVICIRLHNYSNCRTRRTCAWQFHCKPLQLINCHYNLSTLYFLSTLLYAYITMFTCSRPLQSSILLATC